MQPRHMTLNELSRIIEDTAPGHANPKVFHSSTSLGEIETHHGFHDCLGHFAAIVGPVSSEMWICTEADPADLKEFFADLDQPVTQN